MKTFFYVFFISLFAVSLSGCENLFYYNNFVDINALEKNKDTRALKDYDRIVDSTTGDTFIIRKESEGACSKIEPNKCILVVRHKDGSEETLRDFNEDGEYTLRKTIGDNDQAIFLKNPTLLEVKSSGHLIIEFKSFDIHMGEVFATTSVVDYDTRDESVEELISLKQIGELTDENSERDSSYYVNSLLTTPNGAFLAILDTDPKETFSDEKLPGNGIYFKTRDTIDQWYPAECPGLKLPLKRFSQIGSMPYEKQNDDQNVYIGMWFSMNDKEFFIDTSIQKCLAPQ